MDRISELRLTGLARGSTILELRLGDEEALPMTGTEEDIVARRLEESFRAIATNTPPSWASPLVKESIGRLLSRIEAAGATRVTASWESDGAVLEQAIAVSDLSATVWAVDEQRETEQVSMTGRLDKVDLRARRFRIRDDVGHDITLEDVIDLDTAAHLIGQRVVASGAAERSNGRVVRIVEPTLSLERLPEEWSVPVPSGPPQGGIPPTGGIEGISAAGGE